MFCLYTCARWLSPVFGALIKIGPRLDTCGIRFKQFSYLLNWNNNEKCTEGQPAADREQNEMKSANFV